MVETYPRKKQRKVTRARDERKGGWLILPRGTSGWSRRGRYKLTKIDRPAAAR